MTISERVENSFKEDAVDSDEMRGYLTELRVNWRQAELTLSRTIGLIMLIGAVFELLTRGAVSEVSLEFVKITGAMPLITAALPVIAAYLTLNLAMLLEDVTLYGKVHNHVFKIRLKSLYENDMEVPLHPPVRFGVGGRFTFGRGTFINKLGYELAKYSRAVIYLLTPVTFVAYAYVRLLMIRGFSDVLLWSSLSISVFLLVSATLIFLDFMINWY